MQFIDYNKKFKELNKDFVTTTNNPDIDMHNTRFTQINNFIAEQIKLYDDYFTGSGYRRNRTDIL